MGRRDLDDEGHGIVDDRPGRHDELQGLLARRQHRDEVQRREMIRRRVKELVMRKLGEAEPLEDEPKLLVPDIELEAVQDAGQQPVDAAALDLGLGRRQGVIALGRLDRVCEIDVDLDVDRPGLVKRDQDLGDREAVRAGGRRGGGQREVVGGRGRGGGRRDHRLASRRRRSGPRR